MKAVTTVLTASVAETEWDSVNSVWVYDDPEFTLNGNVNFYYQMSGMELGFFSLPFKTVSWREINPEIEP